MKSKLSFLFLVVIAQQNSSAVIVTADSGGFSQAIVNSANLPIPISEGFISVGYFATYNASTNFGNLSGLDLAADFVSFGSSFQFGGTGFDGFYSSAVNGGRIDASSSFLGRNVVTLIGNRATLGASTEALAYVHSVTFPNDVGSPAPAPITTVPGDSGNAGYLFGGPVSGTTTVAGAPIPAIPLARLVPEPSALLLSVLGLFSLLRRKR